MTVWQTLAVMWFSGFFGGWTVGRVALRRRMRHIDGRITEEPDA